MNEGQTKFIGQVADPTAAATARRLERLIERASLTGGEREGTRR